MSNNDWVQESTPRESHQADWPSEDTEYGIPLEQWDDYSSEQAVPVPAPSTAEAPSDAGEPQNKDTALAEVPTVLEQDNDYFAPHPRPEHVVIVRPERIPHHAADEEEPAQPMHQSVEEAAEDEAENEPTLVRVRSDDVPREYDIEATFGELPRVESPVRVDEHVLEMLPPPAPASEAPDLTPSLSPEDSLRSESDTSSSTTAPDTWSVPPEVSIEPEPRPQSESLTTSMFQAEALPVEPETVVNAPQRSDLDYLQAAEQAEHDSADVAIPASRYMPTEPESFEAEPLQVSETEASPAEPREVAPEVPLKSETDTLPPRPTIPAGFSPQPEANAGLGSPTHGHLAEPEDGEAAGAIVPEPAADTPAPAELSDAQQGDHEAVSSEQEPNSETATGEPEQDQTAAGLATEPIPSDSPNPGESEGTEATAALAVGATAMAGLYRANGEETQVIDERIQAEVAEEERRAQQLKAEKEARNQRLGRVATSEANAVRAPQPVQRRGVGPFGSAGLFLLRLVVAALVGIIGYQMLSDVSSTAAFLGQSRIPEPRLVAWVAGFTLFAIALFLVIGLAVRVTGLLLAIIAGCALAFIRWGAFSPFVAGAEGFLGDRDLLLMTIGLMLVTLGGGRFGIDGAIAKSRAEARAAKQV